MNDLLSLKVVENPGFHVFFQQSSYHHLTFINLYPTFLVTQKKRKLSLTHFSLIKSVSFFTKPSEAQQTRSKSCAPLDFLIPPALHFFLLVVSSAKHRNEKFNAFSLFSILNFIFLFAFPFSTFSYMHNFIYPGFLQSICQGLKEKR